MSEKRKMRQYNQEFKEEALKLLLQEGLSVSSVAKDLGIPPSTIHGWIAQNNIQKSVNAPISNTSDLDKVKDLEKQVKRLTMERDILKKAMAYFAEIPK